MNPYTSPRASPGEARKLRPPSRLQYVLLFLAAFACVGTLAATAIGARNSALWFQLGALSCAVASRLEMLRLRRLP